MAQETNLQTIDRFLTPANIDFVEVFGKGIHGLKTLLGIQRTTRLPQGTTIQTYKSSVTLDGTEVGPGEIIPLSKVVREKDKSYTLSYDKKRLATPVEVIQAVGFTQAIAETDTKLIRELQRNIRDKFFGQLDLATKTDTAKNLQDAYAKAWAFTLKAFEDDAPSAIVFVNPDDVADHIAKAGLTVQTAFGLSYVEGFTGVKTIIISPRVAKGTMYVTAPQNLNLAYAPTTSGEIAKAGFGFYSDDTGLIGVTHDVNKQRLQSETITLFAMLLYAERTDGICKITIEQTPGI